MAQLVKCLATGWITGKKEGRKEFLTSTTYPERLLGSTRAPVQWGSRFITVFKESDTDLYPEPDEPSQLP